MNESERSKYWQHLADQIWEAIQRPSPAVTRDEIALLSEKAFRAFYCELYLRVNADGYVPPKYGKSFADVTLSEATIADSIEFLVQTSLDPEPSQDVTGSGD
jgi:hypothetical protein